MNKIRCTDHGVIVAEKIEPCSKYPSGAVKIKGKHHGKECEHVISLAPVQVDVSTESETRLNQPA